MGLFKFKEFHIAQDRCAQKVGTDGVLLGAWTTPHKIPQNILDIGTGTGVISLMLAQRFTASNIEAIEIDTDAFEQATENFENSPWGDRLFCFHSSFQEFYEEVEERFDLIVSNPPFFDSNSLKKESQIEEKRQQARFDDALPFEELVYGVYQLLALDGTFSCIIPKEREERFLEITSHFQLTPVRTVYIKGTANSPVKRCLMEFRFRESVKETNTTPTIEHLTIEIARHDYTDDYINLTKDFYLKM
ncbi:tRNA1Val (adenine37-N6)-methyltransferase [Nonlabens dokdonensis]|uniref:tRNA1(Val) (adenine(37)-N6)-methyltransferase n=2 Tax=Nonlabens dokdonensis TaxID=328515 RepID=L7W7A0_NONDD|nr:methyltransferase [Nonlabens dokdonensis]AGC76019.1 methyltransferase [Nonlabens dokdonensis DSW-6]PZX43691.1 tRNA1Val (adenine37-N6)-methyltransferase [Nonlabens dokdonensis]